ncbi:ADP-ribosylglycohydrolase family protein [Bifidobacterium saguinibicoloris]|uniref:ADP-ribosylglycohydrolase family protein n=1 Tax=Bifidobacterium saguinibicoloris TaxID=2834433 RepID=UPI001C576FE8|nr:ADP-ribosylglycohydrolase family protein [Bifidobacterium saguinibicoloris]
MILRLDEFDNMIGRCSYANCDAIRTEYDDGTPYGDVFEVEDDLHEAGWVTPDNGDIWYCPRHAAFGDLPIMQVREPGHFTAADFARLHAAVYGQAVGDALGVPYEFKTRDAFECTDMTGHGTHDQPAGTWSDDTAMMLATLDSLADNKGRVNPKDMLAKYRAWITDGAYTPDGTVFDVGNTTSRALATGHGGIGERDNGNGSLMRILPLAFVDCSDDDVRAASAVTHAHRISTEACVRFVRIARILLADGAAFSRTEVCREAGLIDDLRFRKRREVSSGGFVLDTLQAALWCLVNTASFRDCVLAAVNLGGDTDTTAAVAGGLAGLVYGDDGNPWEGEMRGADLLESLVAKAAVSLPGLHPRVWRDAAVRKEREAARKMDAGVRKLVALAPRFEEAWEEGRKLYDDSHTTDRDENGDFVYRGVRYDPLVDEWWHAVYEAWGNRGDYHDVLEELGLEDPRERAEFYRDGDFDTLDLDSTLTLLLFPTREERFGDGALCWYLDNGAILRLLRHLTDFDSDSDAE